MFAERRTRLMEALGEGAAIFAAAHEVRRNGDVDFEFRQDSTFLYLTGFEEPDAIAVLRPGHDEPFVLFVSPHDPEMAVWVGPRAGVEGAVEQFGADAAYPIEQFEELLPDLLKDADAVHVALGADDRVDRAVSSMVERRRDGSQRGPAPIARLLDPTPAVDGLRLIKTEAEITALQQAIDVTGAGLRAAWKALRPGMREYEVQAVLEAEYRRSGSPRNGFPSIVASGPMSCTLHYTSNRRVIEDGDLLLLDTGAEWDYYSADVTRTAPANGRFTPEQRAVYDIVLEAQRRGIEATAPGVPFHDVHQASLRVLVEGLIDLEILTGDVDAAIEEQTYRPYYMHSTSHWLGLDVHDVGPYRSGETSTPLAPGMVLTVEPGLYLAAETPGIPEPLRGIGIRIEDDVLVTPDGRRNLSGGIPSAPDELEALVRE
ncbi:MAG: M24 family metallopeptidase [Dehalococcoidia bacterium]|nr:M24 family metallopeptidase [Dehalococcoidia bacterium]